MTTRLSPGEVERAAILHAEGNSLNSIVALMSDIASAATWRKALMEAGKYQPGICRRMKTIPAWKRPGGLPGINETMAAWASKPLNGSGTEASA